MSGCGMRTLSSGQVKAGRWRAGVMEEQMEPWQCANAVEGAAEAAAAARRCVWLCEPCALTGAGAGAAVCLGVDVQGCSKLVMAAWLVR